MWRVRRGNLWALSMLAALVIATPSSAAEVEVRMEVEPERVGLDQLVTLSIEVESTGIGRLDMNPQFELENLEVVRGPSRSERFRFVNGATSRSLTLTWYLRPLAVGKARVFGVRIEMPDRTLELVSREIEVLEKGPQPPPSQHRRLDPFEELFGRRRPRHGPRRQPKVFLRAEVVPTNPYVGQQALYSLYLYTQTDVRSPNPRTLPSFQGLWVREVPQAERVQPERVEVDGESFARVVLMQRALFPLRPGSHELEPAEVEMLINVMDDRFLTAFPRSRAIERRSNPVHLSVRPLPPSPSGFDGAVGRLELTASLEPQEVEVGEAATLTLTLSGQGHFQGLPAPEPPELAGLEVLPPQQESREELAGTTLRGTRSWSFVVIPRQPGSWRLPPVEVPYFDPYQQEYRLASASAVELRAVTKPGQAAAGYTEAKLHPVRSSAVPTAPGWRWRSLLVWLFVLPWLLGTVALWWQRHRHGIPTSGVAIWLEEELRQIGAEKRPSRAARRLEQAWRRYLLERWQVGEETPGTEWAESLAAQGADLGATTELTRLVEDLHYLRHAPQLSSSDALLADVIARSQRVLRRLQ